jgi:hypothetical protein
MDHLLTRLDALEQQVQTLTQHPLPGRAGPGDSRLPQPAEQPHRGLQRATWRRYGQSYRLAQCRGRAGAQLLQLRGARGWPVQHDQQRPHRRQRRGSTHRYWRRSYRQWGISEHGQRRAQHYPRDCVRLGRGIGSSLSLQESSTRSPAASSKTTRGGYLPGVHKQYLHLHLATYETKVKAKRITLDMIRRMWLGNLVGDTGYT